ncbi:MAG: hypothetical protein AAGG51_14735 [Cyanobacteria bacterium P01_G01_bin.54]
MTPYQDICRQVQQLTPKEQRALLAELTTIIHLQNLAKPKRSILELEGLGKEIWQGMDAQTFVDQERTSWI